MNKIRDFKELKKILDEKNNELAEAKGKLSAIQKQAKDEFGTDDIDELTNLEEKLKEEKEELENKKEELEEQIENLLSEIEDDQ